MIYTNSDGGARGNPGPGAIGVIVREDNNILLEYTEKIPGKVTNNYAEYMALIKALELVQKYTSKEVTCIMDSELVVRQLLGEYQVRDPKLEKLFLQVQELQKNFEKINYQHVRRKDKFQTHADYLLNKKLDENNKNIII